jgi:hypothetical protein
MSNREDWPTQESTVVRQPGGPPPLFSPPPGVPPPGSGPDDGIGWGFLIGILVALAIAGVVIAAILLTRHHHHPATTTTVVVRTGQTTTATTPKATTPTRTTTTTAGTTTTAPAPATPKTVSVPTVSGPAQGAVQSLTSAGLMVTLAYVPNNQPLGTVVATSPSSGASAPAGSHVTLNLSKGPNASPAGQVPTLTGDSIPQAVQAVKQAGLRLIFVRKTVTDRSQAGKVVEQTPSPGTSLPKNAQVLVYMGAVR